MIMDGKRTDDGPTSSATNAHLALGGQAINVIEQNM